MRNIKYVFKAAVAACLGSVVAASAVIIAPGVGVNAAALTNGPILFANSTGGISAVNTDASSATVPTFIKGVPTYSADGELVTWVEIGPSSSGPVFKLMISKTDGTDRKTLAQSADLNTSFNKPQITADKQKVIFYDKNNVTTNILEVNASTENQTPAVLVASSSAVKNISDISLSVNGDVAFISQGCGAATQAFGVFVKLANTAPAGQPLANTCLGETSGNYLAFKNSYAVAWDTAGNNVFVLRGDTQANPMITEVLLADKANGITTAAIASVPFSYGTMYGLALSPDGSKIAFLHSNPSKISVMDVTGSNLTEISISGVNSPRITWGFGGISSGGGGSAPSSGGSDSSSANSGSTSSGGTTSGGTSGATNNSTTVVPGVTKTDTIVYTSAPQKVAANSAVAVLTKAQTKQQTIVSNTPAVCLPTKEDIVFIDEGRCSVSILDKKSGEVLRRFRTTVVEDSVTELRIGNEVAVLAPIFFSGKSTDVDNKGLRRIRSLASRITSAGKILVVGHSGIALGDTPENRQLSTDRAVATVRAMKKAGAKGPFISLGVGTKDPLVSSTSGKDQARNRRVVIILVP